MYTKYSSWRNAIDNKKSSFALFYQLFIYIYIFFSCVLTLLLFTFQVNLSIFIYYNNYEPLCLK